MLWNFLCINKGGKDAADFIGNFLLFLADNLKCFKIKILLGVNKNVHLEERLAFVKFKKSGNQAFEK